MNLNIDLRKFIRKYAVVSFCLVTFSVSWGSYFLYTLIYSGGERPFLHYVILWQFSPSIAAILLTAITDGHTGIRELGKRLINWRVGAGWLLLAAFFEPALFLFIAFGYWISIGSVPDIRFGSLSDGILSACATFAIGLIRWGFAEEVGWRGWMLPQLQRSLSPFAASMIMAVVVTLWHINPGSVSQLGTIRESEYLYGAYPEVIERLIITIPITLLLTLIFNRTKGSLLPMMMFHSASNTSYFWLKCTFNVVGTDFFRIVLLSILIFMTAILSGILLRQRTSQNATTE